MYIPLAQVTYDSEGSRTIVGKIHAFPSTEREPLLSACGQYEFSFVNGCWAWMLPDELAPVCKVCERALMLNELGE